MKRHPAEFYSPEGSASRIAAANQVIRAVAREHQLPVVDLHEAFAAQGGANDRLDCLIRNVANSGREDGVHPTPAGYRLIGELVARATVREKGHGLRRIVCFGDSITRGVHVAGEGTAGGETYPAFLSHALERAAP